jgi:hypothetical protein
MVVLVIRLMIDRGVVDQRFAAPVVADEAEQAVLGFVPSAGPAREVADDDLQPDSICELLQLYLPQPAAGAVEPAEGPR